MRHVGLETGCRAREKSKGGAALAIAALRSLALKFYRNYFLF
jgi:hypothetical protein